MLKQNKKINLKHFTSLSLRKILLSFVVVILLFPNLLGVGVALAEENTAVEPPIEEVELEVMEAEALVEEADANAEAEAELPPVAEPVLPEDPEVPEEIEEPLSPGEITEPEVIEPEVISEMLVEEIAEAAIQEEIAEAVVIEEISKTTVVAEEPAEEIVIMQAEETYRLGFMVNTAIGSPATNLREVVRNAAGEVIPGSYNADGEWYANEEVPAGRYTITFNPPEINDEGKTLRGVVGLYPARIPQSAYSDGTDNVYIINVNDDNLVSFKLAYTTLLYEEEFHIVVDLVEQFPGATVSRNDIPMTLTDYWGNEIPVEFRENKYYTEILPVGIYYVTFDPPAGKEVIINPAFPRQSASSTVHRNRFRIYNDARFMDFSFTTFARFEYIDELPDDFVLHPLALTIKNKEGVPVTNVGIAVTNSDGKIIDGYFEDGLSSWFTRGALPEGRYTITLTPPTGMVTKLASDVDDAVTLLAIAEAGKVMATDTPNVYYIDIKTDHSGVQQTFYGDFLVLSEEDETPKPVDPPDPVDPVDPTDPTAPTDPTDPVDPTEPTAPTEPTDPTDPAAPVDPTDPTDPVDEDDVDADEMTDEDDNNIKRIYLPKTGVSNSTVTLGFISLLTGLGLYATDKKRKK